MNRSNDVIGAAIIAISILTVSNVRAQIIEIMPSSEYDQREKWRATREGKKQFNEQKRREAEKEAREQKAFAKEYPYYAVFKCTTNEISVNFISCLYGERVNTEIELRNGAEYKLYQGAEFSNKFEDYEGGKLVNLRTKFDISAQNARNNLILGVKIYDRASKRIVFQKQVSQFGVIKVHN